MPGPKPWTTAAGCSAAVETGTRPRSLTASRSAVAPMTRTFDLGGSLSASSRAAAWAEVTTSASVTGAPMPSSRAATAAGVREALLVT